MAITNLQQEPSINKQVSDPAKPHNQTLEDIKDFHEDLESERVQRVLQRWRKRKRDEELRNGTVILEKILRAVHDGLEERKERAALWEQALIAEIKPDKARRELEDCAAASTLSMEKQTQFVHAVTSHLNLELPSEELGRILSKTTAAPASAAESLMFSPPTPPADQHGLATPHDTRPLHIGNHIKEPESRRLAAAPRTPGPLSRSASQAGSRDDHAAYPQDQITITDRIC
ncbi:hypothetical protein Daus18300_002526 [Diaporthe australafricana]|uniref:Uncharacterized protein n=1 Tax=Diaporthe australafricana TaxID=127596 RepID=A0ABR3XMD8_9PEZI